MGNCLCCGTIIKDGVYTCVSCHIKFGQSHVIVSQEEYQSLRYKEMVYDATKANNEDMH